VAVSTLFHTTTSAKSPLDGSSGDPGKAPVSEFLTIQALTNFAAMTGAITAAWNGLRALDPRLFSGIWVPYGFALIFGIVSILISLEGLHREGKRDVGTIAGAIFIALINALVLASAVVGATGAARAVAG
jgi:hypothetical protein